MPTFLVTGSYCVMSSKARFFEWFIQGTILVSILVHLVDLQLVRDQDKGTLVSVLNIIDIVVVIIFSIEYLVRWFYATDRWRYPFTFMAMIDLLVILPFYLSFLLDVRSLRVIRMARALQLLKFYRYSQSMQSFVATIRKVGIQLEVMGFVLAFVVLVSSTALYEAERDVQPDKIRHMGDALWWCVVTLATVGYGDISPVTMLGRTIATLTMIVGLGIFGTFISIIGSAFISAMQDEEHRSLTLTLPVYRRLKQCMKECDEPVDIEHLKHHAEQAVMEYIDRKRNDDLRE